MTTTRWAGGPLLLLPALLLLLLLLPVKTDLLLESANVLAAGAGLLDLSSAAADVPNVLSSVADVPNVVSEVANVSLVGLLQRAVVGLEQLLLGQDVHDGEQFEFVVVGGGAAGAAVAARLAAAGRATLLLEAGVSPTPLSTVPLAVPTLLGSDMDWQYPTLPNNASCLGYDGGFCRASRGRALGGSTATNFMMYVRGNRADYDLPLAGWSWRELEPFFLRAEGLRDLQRLPRSSAAYHNTSGPVRVGYCNDPENPWHARLTAGLRALGFPVNRDVNAQSQIGVTRLFTYTAGGRRESTATAYLARPAVRRSLRVATGMHVTRVLIDEDRVARGVTAVHGASGREVTVRATRAVVLSAGALATPQLLMLSGVGPAPHLESLGIPVLVDQPAVGADLRDHVLPLLFIAVPAPPLEVLGLGVDALQYPLGGAGPLGSIGLTDLSAFANTSCYDAVARNLRDAGASCELPSTQLYMAYVPRGVLALDMPLVKQVTRFNDDILTQLKEANLASGLIVASPALLVPHSRGSVRLASTDPLALPAIFPNYLDDERDVDEMLRSVTIVQHLAQTKPLRAHGAKLLRLRLAGCPAGRGYWRCYVRHMTFTVFHSAGSAALGTALGPRLDVVGVERLRVADMSALPRPPRGNPAAAAIALGERLAHFLLEELGNPHTAGTADITTEMESNVI